MCSKHTAGTREEYHTRFLTGEDGFTGRIRSSYSHRCRSQARSRRDPRTPPSHSETISAAWGLPRRNSPGQTQGFFDSVASELDRSLSRHNDHAADPNRLEIRF